MPIYKVTTPTETRYVEAENKAAAVNHVIRPGVTAEALSPSQIVAAMRDGANVEAAGFKAVGE